MWEPARELLAIVALRKTRNGGTMTETETRFNTYLKTLELIRRELGSKGLGAGDSHAWIEDYVYRLQEVAQGLHEIATSQPENNPSHTSYP